MSDGQASGGGLRTNFSFCLSRTTLYSSHVTVETLSGRRPTFYIFSCFGFFSGSIVLRRGFGRRR